MTEKNSQYIYSKNININNSKRLVFELEDESENNSENELEREFELQVNKKNPINYGSKWTDKDRNELIKLLKNIKKESEKNKIISNNDNELELKRIIILEIGNKLGRTEGGIISEIKKIIFNMYMNGSDFENISSELNLTFKAVKSIIKIFIDKECEQEIKTLEKENKLLRLKIDNYNLRKELKKLL
jgi:hypothetical protein